MTNFSPFELFFGRLPGLPVDLFLPGQGDSALSGFDQLRTIESECRARSEKLIEAEKQIRFKFQGHKMKYEPGDLVWYYKPTAGKLRRDWEGPFKITQKINDTVVEIADGNDKRIKVLIYKLKPYVDRKEMLDSLPGGFQDLSDDEEEGEIFTSDLQGGGKQCRSEDEYSSSSPVEESRQDNPEPERRGSWSSGSGEPERRSSSSSESINLSQDGDSFASEEEAELSKLESSGSS